MKIKKLIALLLSLAMLVCMFAGCGHIDDVDNEDIPAAAKTDVNLFVIAGPTGIGAADLIEQNSENDTANNYNVNIVSDPQEIVSKIATKEADIAAVPTNLASTLYNKTSGGVQVLALNTLGVLYILENGNTVNSVSDLSGKTIYSTGEGANPQYILEHVLKENGVTDVTVEYLTENDELAAKMVSGAASIALVPQPVATTVMMKNSSVRIALDMTEEWNSVQDGTRLVMGCVIARNEFIQNNPKAVEAFLKEYRESIEEANEDTDDVALACEKHGIIPSAAVAKQAIPYCNITFISGDKMKSDLSDYLTVLMGANPKSIGGALPGDDFYYGTK